MESSVSWSVPTSALQVFQRRFEQQARSAPRVMLLTSSLGAGHTRAASAIERGILQQAPECATETVDFWSLLHPAVGDAVKHSYLRLVTDRPQLYQRIYQLDQHFWRRILERGETPPALLHELYRLVERPAGPLTGLHHWLDRTMFGQLAAILAPAPAQEGSIQRRWHRQMITFAWGALAHRLQRRIHRFAPDVIIATQVNMGALAADLKRRGKCDARLLGVPTDFGVHDFWAQKEIDVLCIADRSLLPEAEVELPRAARVEVTGLPLMPEFCNPVDPTMDSMAHCRCFMAPPGCVRMACGRDSSPSRCRKAGGRGCCAGSSSSFAPALRRYSSVARRASNPGLSGLPTAGCAAVFCRGPRLTMEVPPERAQHSADLR